MDQNKEKILMYHGIVSSQRSIPAKREVGAELYDVSEQNFREQIGILQKNSYKGVLIDEDIVSSEKKCITITFDDGEMNNYTSALPILLEFEFKAYFFVIIKRIGKPGYMGWEELRGLINKGMIVGSHGLSHEILTNLADTQVEEELSASKKNLERNLETEINSFSIPRGFCNNKIIQMAYDVGYKNIFISERPRRLNKHCISRTAVKGSWSTEKFEMVINNAVPLTDQIKDNIKKTAKFILRESGYNFFRSVIIKIVK